MMPQELPRLGPLRLPENSLAGALFRRGMLALAILLFTILVMWLVRDGIRDHTRGAEPLSFTDVVYFTIVSLTTLGYGDITPISTEARMVNAFILTPVRLSFWILFLGTAYELTVMRMRMEENRKMNEVKNRLDGHVIVCGYGVKGKAILDELVAHGHDPQQIVVIDPSDQAMDAAADAGVVAFRGDASSEDLLHAASIEKAAYVLAVPNRDDACVLICLTVRSLAPNVRLIAAAREEENVKLLYGAGANLVVAPSVSGGRLIASAVRQHAVPHVLEDLLSFGEGLTIAEYEVTRDQEGRLVSEIDELRDDLIVGMMRGMHRYPFFQLKEERLQAGDMVVYIAHNPDSERAEAAEDNGE